MLAGSNIDAKTKDSLWMFVKATTIF